MNQCPHCNVGYGDTLHVCTDHDRWTNAERDQWREDARRRFPSLKFVPNSMQLANQLGSRSQRKGAP